MMSDTEITRTGADSDPTLSADRVRDLCVALQSHGVRMDGGAGARTGGAGPAEGQVLVVGDRYLSVPMRSWYVSGSPYSLVLRGKTPVLQHDGVDVLPVGLPPRPRVYDETTPEGISLERIALLHGCDCLASTIDQHCCYWKTDLQCRFCGIGLSLEQGTTIGRKRPEDLGLAAERARDLDGAAHVTLTLGAAEDEEAVRAHVLECITAVRERSGLPVHIQVCPVDDAPHLFAELHNAGADTIGIHIESWSPAVLQRVAPAKARIGRRAYLKNWAAAVAQFGPGQVSSFLIVGLGESPDSIVAGADAMAAMGVYPFVLPLRPVPETPLGGCAPPAPEYMLQVYEAVGQVVGSAGLSRGRSRAGCVRCGACSCLSMFEQA